MLSNKIIKKCCKIGYMIREKSIDIYSDSGWEFMVWDENGE
ncbi:immunity protein Imm33 domain-containing protein [Clostridioides difficile]|nr:DUF2185 domain-containing protein [Clostridioides difficile]AVD41343.1 DUF2185 domain-containing protein [Clostridioides difficile]AVD44844.1 DUF2185 domain-containing protein [Clostridioides difficile]EGT2237899.1 DUF2185 domain-containing protein [Clostridioides difficile]EGT3685411.1 DUF2185 domain-containing protein [Clostridioides difficile]